MNLDNGSDSKIVIAFGAVWILAMLVSLAVTGVVIWAIIELVMWLTSK